MNQRRNFTTVLAICTLFVATMVFLSGKIYAGELNPPAGPPSSTMKTLDEIPPTWSQSLNASERFELVLGGQGVLDKETGLVWEQSPDGTFYAPNTTTINAICTVKTVGLRRGWRAPTIQELASLIDPTQTNPALPSGHPFTNLQTPDPNCVDPGCPGCPAHAYYMSLSPGIPYHSFYTVDFNSGSIQVFDPAFWGSNCNLYFIWCVRGR